MLRVFPQEHATLGHLHSVNHLRVESFAPAKGRGEGKVAAPSWSGAGRSRAELRWEGCRARPARVEGGEEAPPKLGRGRSRGRGQEPGLTSSCLVCGVFSALGSWCEALGAGVKGLFAPRRCPFSLRQAALDVLGQTCSLVGFGETSLPRWLRSACHSPHLVQRGEKAGRREKQIKKKVTFQEMGEELLCFFISNILYHLYMCIEICVFSQILLAQCRDRGTWRRRSATLCSISFD